ncbi:ferrochelatase, partial [Salmonella enterica]|nr:ferrochelatase [Salmonella enterica]
KLAALLPNIPVDIGMSYGSPSIKTAIDNLMEQGVTDLVVLPLYPQYSCTTTAAVYDAVTRAFQGRRTIPSVQFIRSYATHPAYIKA